MSEVRLYEDNAGREYVMKLEDVIILLEGKRAELRNGFPRVRTGSFYCYLQGRVSGISLALRLLEKLEKREHPGMDDE